MLDDLNHRDGKEFGDLAALLGRLDEPAAPLDEGLFRIATSVAHRERSWPRCTSLWNAVSH